MNKTLLKVIGMSAFSVLMLQSCAKEDMFGEKGDATLSLRMVVNSEVTRAVVEDQSLSDKCVIYISDAEGLLYKFKGLSSLPANGIPLKSGNYVAEAWTGDSVSASFDKKFFRAYQPMTIVKGANNVTLNCNIANVVASVDASTIDNNLLKDYTITIGNSAASLEFNEENVATAKGYFMMPNDDTTLNWCVVGKDAAGRDFSKEGQIFNVERAHEYILNFKFGSDNPDSVGGAFITIEIDDTEILVEDDKEMHSVPKVSGIDFDINAPLSGEPGTFSETSLSFMTYGHATSCTLTFAPYSAFAALPTSTYNIADLATATKTELTSRGISWTESTYGGATIFGDYANNHTTGFITFSASILNQFPLGEYTVTIALTDELNRTTTKVFTILVSNDSVVPVEAATEDISSYAATLTASIVKDDVTNPGIEYRQVGTSAWTTVYPTKSRAAGTTISVRVTGLKAGTTYEYRAIADGFTSSQTMKLTTDPVFSIPNASFEEWSECAQVGGSKKVLFPGSGSERTFWDTGNHGSMTMNKKITENSSEIVHTGTYSAKLISQFVGVGSLGKFAAGNIFSGEYMGTDGTDGILSFGRPFDGSHPVKLRGWANYRPGTVAYPTSNFPSGIDISMGSNDQGQIYVALATSPSEIKTKNQSQLFDPKGSNIVAYGQVTWKDNFGPDGAMAQFEIDLEYYDRSVKPSYIIIVASASKFGDYFAGGNSVMYLDDFELVYE